MQPPETAVTDLSGDSNSLFNMFITPQDTEINDGMNIEGGNISVNLGQDNNTAIIITIPAPETTSSNQSVDAENMKGNNETTTETSNMKGNNVLLDGSALKGQNDVTDPEMNVLQVNTSVPVNQDGHEDTFSEPENEHYTDKSINVSDVIQDLWKHEAAKNLAYVPIKRLTPGDVYSLGSKKINWDDIDPYSSLEEEEEENELPENQSEDIIEHEHTQEQPQPPSVIGMIYYMRDRSKITERHSSKPLCENRTAVNYSEMDINDDTSSPKRPVKKPRVSATGPSADRINAQNIISLTPGTPNPILSPKQDRRRKRFFQKDPRKLKSAHRKIVTPNLKLEQMENQEDQPQILIVPNDQDTNKIKKSDEDVKPKGVFNTTKHSLVKHKTVRYFKCPICGIHSAEVE